MKFCLSLFVLVVTVHAGERIFPADAVVDLTRVSNPAIPDDGRDDTAAIQRAVSEHAGSGRVLFLPAGVYDISAPICATNAQGIWRAHLTLQGQGRDKTILRLRDGAKAFGDATQPRAMIATGSHQEPGDSADGGGNKAFRNNILDMTLDTGRGNPGVMGIDYAVSNIGTIENVTLRDPAGTASTGISMRRRIPGPGLLKKVRIEGFGVGLALNDIQYGMTAEDLTLVGQREAGIVLGKNLLHLRGLVSTNRVPAIRVTDALGTLTLLDAQLTGGDATQLAIDAAGPVCLRNVKATGYAELSFRFAGRAQEIDEFVAWPNLGTAALASFLPVLDTPFFWNDDLSDWCAVGPRAEGEPDDTAAIQRACDSGKRTIYFPNNRVYFLSDTVVLRGRVKQLLGMGAEISLGAAEAPFSNAQKPRPLFRVDPGESDILFLEHLFFNAQYRGEVIFEHNAASTLVIRHCGGWIGGGGYKRTYQATPAARNARVFVEDAFMPGWAFTGQHVYARQFNPENWECDGSEPQVLNRGGTLWILGFKTEGPAPFIVSDNHAVTELFGGYNYISATRMDPLPPQLIPYTASNSIAFLTFVADNFRGNDYTTYLRGNRDYTPRDLPRRPVSERSIVVSGLLLE